MNATALRAAVAYFGIVFGAGFVFGSVRTLVLVPAIGSRAAELLEVPLMLVVIAFAASFVSRRLLRAAPMSSHVLARAPALVLVLIADTCVGLFLRGMTLREVFLERDPLTGALYYAMLLVFAAMPALMSWRRR
jgi:hypothetical protein